MGPYQNPRADTQGIFGNGDILGASALGFAPPYRRDSVHLSPARPGRPTAGQAVGRDAQLNTLPHLQPDPPMPVTHPVTPTTELEAWSPADG